MDANSNIVLNFLSKSTSFLKSPSEQLICLCAAYASRLIVHLAEELTCKDHHIVGIQFAYP
jgi:hypothetical protein